MLGAVANQASYFSITKNHALEKFGTFFGNSIHLA